MSTGFQQTGSQLKVTDSRTANCTRTEWEACGWTVAHEAEELRCELTTALPEATVMGYIGAVQCPAGTKGGLGVDAGSSGCRLLGHKSTLVGPMLAWASQ